MQTDSGRRELVRVLHVALLTATFVLYRSIAGTLAEDCELNCYYPKFVLWSPFSLLFSLKFSLKEEDKVRSNVHVV